LEESLSHFDLKAAALNDVARHYAKPWLVRENFAKYAEESRFDALLSTPNLPRELKKQIIKAHLTSELEKAFDGRGDPQLPPAIAQIVAEEYCDKLPINKEGDWIGALNAMAGAPDYKPDDLQTKVVKPNNKINGRPEPSSYLRLAWSILCAILFSSEVFTSERLNLQDCRGSA
jgi:hypothetical protein